MEYVLNIGLISRIFENVVQKLISKTHSSISQVDGVLAYEKKTQEGCVLLCH